MKINNMYPFRRSKDRTYSTATLLTVSGGPSKTPSLSSRESSFKPLQTLHPPVNAPWTLLGHFPHWSLRVPSHALISEPFTNPAFIILESIAARGILLLRYFQISYY